MFRSYMKDQDYWFVQLWNSLDIDEYLFFPSDVIDVPKSSLSNSNGLKKKETRRFEHTNYDFRLWLFKLADFIVQTCISKFIKSKANLSCNYSWLSATGTLDILFTSWNCFKKLNWICNVRKRKWLFFSFWQRKTWKRENNSAEFVKEINLQDHFAETHSPSHWRHFDAICQRSNDSWHVVRYGVASFIKFI